MYNTGVTCSKLNVYELDRTNCSPGYTRIKLVPGSNTIEPKYKILVLQKEGDYICYSYSIKDQNHVMVDVNGVKINKLDKDEFVMYDLSLAFECICPGIIDTWVKQNRINGWPNPKPDKNTISALEGHVVPIANTVVIHLESGEYALQKPNCSS